MDRCAGVGKGLVILTNCSTWNQRSGRQNLAHKSEGVTLRLAQSRPPVVARIAPVENQGSERSHNLGAFLVVTLPRSLDVRAPQLHAVAIIEHLAT